MLIKFSRHNKYQTLEEFYPAVNDLIAKLKQEKFIKESNKLSQLMELPWTTGSELLGEFTIALKKMNMDYPKDIKNEIKACLYFAKNHRKILKLDR